MCYHLYTNYKSLFFFKFFYCQPRAALHINCFRLQSQVLSSPVSTILYDNAAYHDQTRPGDFSSVGARPPPGFGDWSEPFDEAVDEDDGETPDEAVVRSTEGAAPLDPLIEKGDLRLAEVDEAEEEARIPGALVGGSTPPSPPNVLWYVSSKDMSPEPRCGPP